MRVHRFLIFCIVAAASLNQRIEAQAAERQVRVATYNIKFLKASISADRSDRIKSVIADLDADIVGLQEIDDRAALESVFDTSVWQLVIDDDSNDAQDVALAVRKPLKIVGLNTDPNDFDADEDDFLFPGSQNNSSFPGKRDVLSVQVDVPDLNRSMQIMVMHPKARVGGRDTTDPRRESAARQVLSVLEPNFDGKDVILVGDWNDNPDDRSLNILESGDPNTVGGPEQIDGPFLTNLTEALVVDDHCSWGIKPTWLTPDGRLNTIVAGSRDQNNAERDTSGHVRPILFDQILITPTLRTAYVPDSIAVFDNPIARVGTSNSAASDHLPVSASFLFSDDVPGPGPGPAPPAAAGVQIVGLLPDPADVDAGKEQVILKNFGTAPVSLQDWRLRDRGGNAFDLSGDVPAGQELTVTLPARKLPLNNSGDDVVLVNADGVVVHHVSYEEEQVERGEVISFTN